MVTDTVEDLKVRATQIGLENLRVLIYQLGLFGKNILTDENGEEIKS